MSSDRTTISYRDRRTANLVVEKTPHEPVLRWLYTTVIGGIAVRAICSRRWFSRLYGWYLCGSSASRRRIAPFIADFDINMDAYEPEPYNSFNDFFVRRFRDGERSFGGPPTDLPAWAEGVCLAWLKVDEDQTIPVKGQYLTAAALLGDSTKAEPFRDGPVMIIRLRPPDYHRFHFVDDGPLVDHWTIRGSLHSVNPRALQQRPDILARNERHVTLQQTQHFGLIAYVEVGAMAVGKIVQSSEETGRGAEKGWFEFGGSTVAIFGVKGAWVPDEDLLNTTREGLETFVELGSRIAAAVDVSPT